MYSSRKELVRLGACLAFLPIRVREHDLFGVGWHLVPSLDYERSTTYVSLSLWAPFGHIFFFSLSRLFLRWSAQALIGLLCLDP